MRGDGAILLSELIEPSACGDESASAERSLFSIAISLRRIANRLDTDAQALEITGPRSGAPARPEEVAPPSLDRQLWQDLTRSERRVAVLLARGLQNQAIAERIGSAEGTVKVHITNIMRKAGVTTRTGFVARLYRLGEPS